VIPAFRSWRSTANSCSAQQLEGPQLNGLDFAILFAFIAIIGLGFFGGIARVAAAIVAIYLGSVISAAFYDRLTDAFRDRVASVGIQTGQLFIFCTVFLLTSGIFWLILANSVKGLKLKRRIEILDNVGGAALGVGVSVLAVTLAAMMLSILLQVLNHTIGQGGDSSLVGTMRGQIVGSKLVPVFLDLTPYFTRVIEPWFPNGLPPILG
jgi:MFS family permease